SRRARSPSRTARTGGGAATRLASPTSSARALPRRAWRIALSAHASPRRRRARAGGRSRGRAASRATRATSAASPLPRLDDPHERADEVVRGRHLADVDPSTQGERAQLRLAMLAGVAESAAEPGVARAPDDRVSPLPVFPDDHAGAAQPRP